MKSHLFSLPLLLLCLCVSGGAYSAQAQHGEHSAEPPAGTASSNPGRNVGVAPAGWTQFSPASKVFSVMLPGQPEENIARSDISAGITVTTHVYTVTNDSGVFMVAHMSDLPMVAEKMPETYKQSFYDGMWKGMAGGIRKELEKNGMLFQVVPVSQRSVVVGGINGREQDFTIGPLQGRAQMALKGQGAFLVMTFLTDEKFVPTRNTFFESFRISAAR